MRDLEAAPRGQAGRLVRLQVPAARLGGAGEGGINAVGATVANAVRDALGLAGGVGQLPLTPARVCALAGQTLAETTEGTR